MASDDFIRQSAYIWQDLMRRLGRIEDDMAEIKKASQRVNETMAETREWRRHMDEWHTDQKEMHKQNQQTLSTIASENRRFSRGIFLVALGAALTGLVSIIVAIINHFALTGHLVK